MAIYLKKYLLLFCFYLLTPPCFAADLTPQTVRDLIVISFEKNIGLRVKGLSVPVATEEIVVKKSSFDTELFASGGFSETTTPLTSASFSLIDQSKSDLLVAETGVRKRFTSGAIASVLLNTEWIDDNSLTDSLDPRYRSSLSLNLSQPLLRNFGNQTNTTAIRTAKNNQDQAVLSHQLLAQSLALQIELLASKLSGEAQVAHLREEAVSLAEDLYAANKRRFSAGVIPVSEVQESETALANRMLNLSLALQARDLDAEALNRQLNYRLPINLRVENFYAFNRPFETAEIPDFESIFLTARQKSISLKLAEIDILNSDIQSNFYKNQLRPQLDLNLQVGLNGLSGEQQAHLPADRYSGSWADSLTSAADADGYQWGIGLNFSLPLGNRLAKSQHRQVQLQGKQIKYQRRDLEEGLKTDLQQQLINLQRACEQVQIADRFEKLAELSLQQEQRRLEEGLSDTFRIIFFQDNMINARIGRINALVQYYSSVARLNFSSGIILERHNIQIENLKEKSFETL